VSQWKFHSQLSYRHIGAVEKRLKVTERVLISEVEKVEIVFDPKNTTEQKTHTVKRHKHVTGM
jgi:hypothetical protein